MTYSKLFSLNSNMWVIFFFGKMISYRSGYNIFQCKFHFFHVTHAISATVFISTVQDIQYVSLINSQILAKNRTHRIYTTYIIYKTPVVLAIHTKRKMIGKIRIVIFTIRMNSSMCKIRAQIHMINIPTHTNLPNMHIINPINPTSPTQFKHAKIVATRNNKCKFGFIQLWSSKL